MANNMTPDDVINQKTALIDDLYASRNKWRDRCLVAEAELKAVCQEVDGAKEVAETAREDADYWKSRIDALNDKIIELRKQAKTIWTSARDAKPPHDTEVLLRTVEFATWQEVETNLGLWAPDGVIDSLTEWRYIEDSDRHLQDELRIQSDIDAADAANYKSGIGY